MHSQQKVGAVIVAAGSGERMGGGDKLTALLSGEPVISRVVRTFENCRLISRIVLVLSEANLERGRQLATAGGWSKVSDICPGGRRRQDSVVAGLKRLPDCAWVVVHDGARPLLSEDLIRRGLRAAEATGAAAAAVPVTDTIKVAGDDMLVRETLPRRELWAVQTPQVFRRDILTGAYNNLGDDVVTDDAAAVERSGQRVKLYMGAYDNIKITTPGDLALAEALLKEHGR
ncbi:MAG: 2-C-methyl-D-erythritol 4-phosphate cytidylyltransferase [Dehalococcoidales bacterium]|nr:2-C-methyl-D-erythritol 4-phosphate cytidylyltransferase [Dehalococcoidales bacterium]